MLQETWLTKQTLDNLNDISDSHLSAGTYVVDCADEVINGRPHGRTAILWSKALNASIFYNGDKSIIELKLSDSVFDYHSINAYLPYCCSTNIDEYLSYLGALEAMHKLLNSSNIVVLGDFNASDSNSFRKLLNDFCCNNNFKLSNKLLLSSNSFTYCKKGPLHYFLAGSLFILSFSAQSN